MDVAKELVLKLKQNNKSHVGYGLQKECEALVGHILQNMAKSQLPPLIPERKNHEDSIRYREEGNQHFVMGDDLEAIESYTLSLAYADSTELMAYAHANRSAALYRKKMYKECLMDIDFALNHGYPEEKSKKLKERAAKAIEEIKRVLGVSSEGHIDIEKIDSLCTATDVDDNITLVKYRNGKDTENIMQQDKILSVNGKTEEIQVDGINNTTLKQDTPKCPRYLAKEGALKLTYGMSAEAPATSDGIKIVFSEKFGRHLVTTKEFKPGDVITIEDPYAYVIYEERYYTHCHHCLSRCYNLMPCPNCPIAQYCSEKCRSLAWEMAHSTECPILALLRNLLNVDKDKIRMLTKIIRLLIMVTGNGSKITELCDDMKIAESNPDNRTAGFTNEGILDSTSARSALSLATNMTTRPLIGISAFACISALAAILMATQTKFLAYIITPVHLIHFDISKD